MPRSLLSSAATGELFPGFVVAPLVGALLALLPFLPGDRADSVRERAMLAALWLAGLIVFAKSFKGLGPWWWCATPLTALALARLPKASDERVGQSWQILLPLVLLAFTPTNIMLWRALHQYEQGPQQRMLPSLKSFAAEPLVRWLTERGIEALALRAQWKGEEDTDPVEVAGEEIPA